MKMRMKYRQPYSPPCITARRGIALQWDCSMKNFRHFLTLIVLVALNGAGLAVAQPAAQEKPLLAEQVFKNVRALKGIPVDDFIQTMGLMAAALQFDCSDCHVGAGTKR